ncbi:MAG: elongation factor 4 [candidate division Zixibacteria bacterium]|nr:elongation factor 4 [candidate division Zixibacteria bacterium]
MAQDHIRNFSIIAHIDHGKSTLADRLLELTKTVEERKMRKQVLDSMDLEQERGITIKSHAIRMLYNSKDGNEYTLNLIDTPGHVDFNYEVSRALSACEGAILVVDAAQGIQAQTVANAYLAIEAGLEIIPVLNKIDLPAADPDYYAEEVAQLLSCDPESVIRVSAKSGLNCEAVLEEIVHHVPPPFGNTEAPLRALVFDSQYDSYHGVIAYVRIVDGSLDARKRIKFFAHPGDHETDQVGYLQLTPVKVGRLNTGEVGFVTAHIRDIHEARVGDTMTTVDNPAKERLPGFQVIKPMVFSGIYPSDADKFGDLRSALEKLRLNDSSLSFEPEQSQALGFGFRCGFLGLLHLEIVKERLLRESGQDIVATVPNVRYELTMTDGTVTSVSNPSEVPHRGLYESLAEPYVRAHIVVPNEFVGPVMTLTTGKRGEYLNTEYVAGERARLIFDIPLAEIVFDYYDRLKSVTRGYGSLDYDFLEFRTSPLEKLELRLAGETVDALSSIVPRDSAYRIGRKMCETLREMIPRQQFEVVIQAAIGGGKPIARETIKPLRKDVTAKLYGGDVTRKRKLLERQKEGKRRMKRVGSIDVPPEAFLAVLKIGD